MLKQNKRGATDIYGAWQLLSEGSLPIPMREHGLSSQNEEAPEDWISI
jgi:hypothetical protein